MILLTLLTMLCFIVPALPSLIEMLRPTDAEPLPVSYEHDTNPFHFANGFKRYLHTQQEDDPNASQMKTTLKDGSSVLYLDQASPAPSLIYQITSSITLGQEDIVLPDHINCEQELFAANNLYTGYHCTLRAALAGGSLTIQPDCKILRWAHAEKELHIARSNILHGRATSRISIVIQELVRFERLHAPKIVVVEEMFYIPSPVTRTLITELPDVRIQSANRWILHGHLEFPPLTEFHGDIISGTTARIGANAHIKGSLKSNARDDVDLQFQRFNKNKSNEYGYCIIEDNATIEGSVISSYNLNIGRHCTITGPVVAENHLYIGAGTTVGTPEEPTTVSAPYITLEPGCVVYGTVWARKQGNTVELENS